MNSRNHKPHLWAVFLLTYLVAAGSVPFFSSILSLWTIHGVNTRRNFELAWGLMNIVPACVGIGLALWQIHNLPIFSAVAAMCLTLQVLFPLMDYRRVGFDPRLKIGLSVPEYLGGMVALGIPFLAMFFISSRKRRRESNSL